MAIEIEYSEAGTNPQRIIACITGMPGAGKSTVTSAGEELGFEVFRMGDDVRMQAERRILQPTDEVLGTIMLELRQKSGPAAIAALCKERIVRDSKSNFTTIDGIRNLAEYREFKKLGYARLIAVHASPERRFSFLQARGRADFPPTLESFQLRDERELSVGIAEAIALANDVLINSGTISELRGHAVESFKSLKNRLTCDNSDTASQFGAAKSLSP